MRSCRARSFCGSLREMSRSRSPCRAAWGRTERDRECSRFPRAAVRCLRIDGRTDSARMSPPETPFTRLEVRKDGPVARVTLARPDVRNAFDDLLIAELTRVFLEFVGEK